MPTNPRARKMPFTHFRCPRCKHEASHAWLVNFWRPRYWCEECGSYFIARNEWFIALIYGFAMAAVFFLAFSGPIAPLAPLFRETDIPGYGYVLGLLASIIAVPISWVLWGTIFS